MVDVAKYDGQEEDGEEKILKPLNGVVSHVKREAVENGLYKLSQPSIHFHLLSAKAHRSYAKRDLGVQVGRYPPIFFKLSACDHIELGGERSGKLLQVSGIFLERQHGEIASHLRKLALDMLPLR